MSIPEFPFNIFDSFLEFGKIFFIIPHRVIVKKQCIVLYKLGMKERAEEYFKSFLDFMQNDNSIYKNLSWSAYYAWQGDRQKSTVQRQKGRK